MNSSRTIAAAFALALAAAAPAAAQELGFYVGGSFGRSSVEIDSAELSSVLTEIGIAHGPIGTDETDTGWKLYFGYRFHRHIAVEGGYADLGKFSASTRITTFRGVPVPPQTLSFEIETSEVFHASALGILPIGDRFSLFGKLGFYSDKTKLTLTGGAGSESESDRDEGFLFGVGVTFDLSRNFAIRGEWERFKDAGSDETSEGDIDLLTLGVMFRF
jgi:OmpA-OmpF porin, OOP family